MGGCAPGRTQARVASRRARPASPIKPSPTSSAVLGSGTGVVTSCSRVVLKLRNRFPLPTSLKPSWRRLMRYFERFYEPPAIVTLKLLKTSFPLFEVSVIPRSTRSCRLFTLRMEPAFAGLTELSNRTDATAAAIAKMATRSGLSRLGSCTTWSVIVPVRSEFAGQKNCTWMNRGYVWREPRL